MLNKDGKTTNEANRLENLIKKRDDGKCPRAFDILFTILKKGKGKLVKLGDIADIGFGIQTGANGFFYLDGMAVKEWRIEEEFLKPLIKNPNECETIEVYLKDLKYKIFMCHKGKKDLKRTNAIKYIEWGEGQGFHELPTCADRQRWWDLGQRRRAGYIVPREIKDIFKVFKNNNVYADKKFYEVYNDSINLWSSMNSSLYPFVHELKPKNFGEVGMSVDTIGYTLSDIPILTPGCLSESIKGRMLNIMNELSSRAIQPIFTELGINPTRPIYEQKPNPLPDRKALDDVIFDIIGLTQDERNEVYWAVCELVKNRLEKARSV